MGTNTTQAHPKCARRYRDGRVDYQMHAEMNVLRFARPGDEIEVMRFSKSGVPTMARPCPHCQRMIRRAGITEVRYTNWEGAWETWKP